MTTGKLQRVAEAGPGSLFCFMLSFPECLGVVVVE